MAFQKIGEVVIVNIGKFCPNINSLYVRVCFFSFGHDFVAEVIKATFAAEKSYPLVFDQVLYGGNDF